MTAGLGRLLRRLDVIPPFVMLDELTAHLEEAIGCKEVVVWLADYDGTELVRMAADQRSATSVLIDDGDRGAVYRNQRPLVAAEDGTHRAFAPITVRRERIGVLEAGMPEPFAGEQLTELCDAGNLLGYVLLAARRYTDIFELRRRRNRLELAAEIQWELLPVLDHEGPDFSIAGWLEPAYDISGDNFDYTVAAEGVTLSISDAMGHGTQAAMLSVLAVAAHRNARRRGLGLRQQVRAANRVILDEFDGDAFVTGLFLRIDREDGLVSLVNAGHPNPLVLRDGNVFSLSTAPDLPVGLFADAQYAVHQTRLLPGDRLLLLSDGIVEAASGTGEQFGLDRVERHLFATASRLPSEVVRQLTVAVADYGTGPLADDATAVCVDYRRAP